MQTKHNNDLVAKMTDGGGHVYLCLANGLAKNYHSNRVRLTVSGVAGHREQHKHDRASNNNVWGSVRFSSIRATKNTADFEYESRG